MAYLKLHPKNISLSANAPIRALEIDYVGNFTMSINHNCIAGLSYKKIIICFLDKDPLSEIDIQYSGGIEIKSCIMYDDSSTMYELGVLNQDDTWGNQKNMKYEDDVRVWEDIENKIKEPRKSHNCKIKYIINGEDKVATPVRKIITNKPRKKIKVIKKRPVEETVELNTTGGMGYET